MSNNDERNISGDLFSCETQPPSSRDPVARLKQLQERHSKKPASKKAESVPSPTSSDLSACDFTATFAMAPKESKVPLTQPLPLWNDSSHAAPNLVTRSALFNIRSNQIRRRMIPPSRKELIMTAGDIQLFMAGEELRQDDADLFFHLLHHARVQARQGGWVHFRAHQVLLEMGWQTSGKGYEQLRRSIERMTNVLLVIEGRDDQLKVQFGEGFSMLGGFAWKDEEGEGLWRVYLGREVINLFWLKFYSRFEWDLRKCLKSRMAKWLHLVYASYANPPQMTVAYLNALSGSSTTRMKKFRETLTKGLDELVEVGFLESWSWLDRRRKVGVQRRIPVQSEGGQILF